MKRFVDIYLKNWKDHSSRKSLLIRGARQVGKTHSVRTFGKSFGDFFEVNFELNPEIGFVFEKDLHPDRIVRELSLIFGRPIIPGKSLLFFDEIQSAPRVLLALRYFYELMPALHVIAAGSLLDFTIEQVGMPVGRVESMYMYPMSFIEFLYALNQDLLVEEILKTTPDIILSELIHRKLLSLVGEYLAVGGMPAVVKSWYEKKDLFECSKLQQMLVDSYRQDFNKYAKKHQLKYLNLLFEHVPKGLGKKFKYSEVGEYQKRELEPCLDLLILANVVTKVSSTAGNGIPLGAEASLSDFKMLFLDIALSQAILGLDLSGWIINPLQELINKGELVEAFVGQEILAYSNPFKRASLFYWHRIARGSQAEVDYLIQCQQLVIPVEVKSGVGTTLKSLHMFLENHSNSPYGIKFSTLNYSKYQIIHSYPLYAVAKVFGVKLLTGEI